MGLIASTQNCPAGEFITAAGYSQSNDGTSKSMCYRCSGGKYICDSNAGNKGLGQTSSAINMGAIGQTNPSFNIGSTFGIRSGFFGGIPGGISGGIPGGISGGIPGGISGGIPGGIISNTVNMGQPPVWRMTPNNITANSVLFDAPISLGSSKMMVCPDNSYITGVGLQPDDAGQLVDFAIDCSNKIRYGKLAANARYVSCPSAIGGTIGNNKNAPYVTGLEFNCIDHPTDQIKPEVPQNNIAVYPTAQPTVQPTVQPNVYANNTALTNDTAAKATNDNSMFLILLFVAIVVGLAVAYYKYGGSDSPQPQYAQPPQPQYAQPPQPQYAQPPQPQ